MRKDKIGFALSLYTLAGSIVCFVCAIREGLGHDYEQMTLGFIASGLAVMMSEFVFPCDGDVRQG